MDLLKNNGKITFRKKMFELHVLLEADKNVSLM